MIYLKFDSEGRVDYKHNYPFNEEYGLGKTKEQLEQDGILVEQLPAKLEEVKGKTQELYYLDGQLQWQYEDIPLTPEQKENHKITELENRTQSVEDAILLLMMEGI